MEPSAIFEKIEIPLPEPIHGLDHLDGVLGTPEWWPTGERVAVVVAHAASWIEAEQRWTHDTDATIRLFDVESGTEVYRFAGHLGQIIAIDISPDGTRLISGCADLTVREWNLEGLLDDAD